MLAPRDSFTMMEDEGGSGDGASLFDEAIGPGRPVYSARPPVSGGRGAGTFSVKCMKLAWRKRRGVKCTKLPGGRNWPGGSAAGTFSVKCMKLSAAGTFSVKCMKLDWRTHSASNA